MAVYQATATAPVNIACIKYWGKRDTKLILPTNSSLSVTLDQDHLRSTTTSRADASFTQDRLWLNGKEDEIKQGGRLATCIAEMKRLRAELEQSDSSKPKISGYNVHIASTRCFSRPTYELPSTPSELSSIARQGSGSACRSLFGGYVAWEMGSKPDGSDSFAVQVATKDHWPDLHALICVVNDAKKGTSSTAGMQRTVETSLLLQHRIAHVVPQRMKDISQAIQDRDFETFGRITMDDSNQFHAVCLDTSPPIFYMNDVSRAIVALVEEFNRASGKIRAAYTYDAGPNAVIYAPKENLKEIVNLIVKYFPQSQTFADPFGVFDAGEQVGDLDLPQGFNTAVAVKHEIGAVKGLIHTRVGDGPRALGQEDALLTSDGLPKPL
ncbi:diphosphomevalonate decarboxylase [Rhizoctonia solani]|uniref:Diphosphomevalonate decarboxylase n=1 Tax=Rhizoctonia solani TaxID=456999 RepID=A0A8H8NYW3_9AGAM|nr:diphosphomevalonate decarboxylase [Rhizoctonia solani]QRW21277.1 diphosphomevalonate decarboxylase [Rhizoctonia solani]